MKCHSVHDAEPMHVEKPELVVHLHVIHKFCDYTFFETDFDTHDEYTEFSGTETESAALEN